jgi:peptide/nickel transport system permease protein
MSLGRYLARRAAGAAVFALVVASLAMSLARLAGGDAEAMYLSPDQLVALRAAQGLDRPWYVQYGQWLAGLSRLDLGRSTLYGRPVADLVGERAFNTALLASAALVFATLIGLPLGRYTGVAQSWPARVARVASLLLLSVPPLIGSLLLVLVAARTGWAPVGGMPAADLAGGAWFAALLRHLPVPALALALPLAATLERLQSRSMAEAAARPFVRASLARGRSVPDALRLHAWPVSLTPVLGVYGVLVAALFSGSFVVETVTAWPGLGRLLMDALHARDVWLVAGCGAAGAALLAVATLVTDVIHSALDPRALGGPR